MGRHRQAVSDWNEVVRLETEGKLPDTGRLARAEARARAGDYTRAVAEARALARNSSLPGHALYDLACVHALSASALCRDAGHPLTQREKKAETWARQALDLLRRADRAGLFRDPAMLENLKKDTDLDFLRPRADFQRWLQGIVNPPPAAPPDLRA
jgi:hypothetical protein